MDLSETDSTIYNVLRRRQQNRDVSHPVGAILFCGIPGSGKTTLAQRLVRDLQAQYVHNDSARELANANGVKKFKPKAVSEALVRTILAEDANKLIVFDATIDHSWRDRLAFWAENSVPTVIIRLNINPEDALARIQKRGRADTDALTELMPRQVANFEACKKELPADIELSVPFDYQAVLNAVKERLTKA